MVLVLLSLFFHGVQRKHGETPLCGFFVACGLALVLRTLSLAENTVCAFAPLGVTNRTVMSVGSELGAKWMVKENVRME